jgi:hypothetical protein
MTWVIDIRRIDENNISKSVGQSVTLTDFLIECGQDDEMDIRVEIFKKMLRDVERKWSKYEKCENT